MGLVMSKGINYILSTSSMTSNMNHTRHYLDVSATSVTKYKDVFAVQIEDSSFRDFEFKV